MQNFHEIYTFFYRKNIFSKFIFIVFISLIIFISNCYFNTNFNTNLNTNNNIISIANSEPIITKVTKENKELLLQNFLKTTITWTADFEQITILDSQKNSDSNNKKTQGKVYLFRPGKFKWQIDKPYTQIIIGNDEKVWLDDPDLQQTTIKKSNNLLEASPMALLAGKNNLHNDFNIENLSAETENNIKNSIKNSIKNNTKISNEISNEISNLIFLRLTPKKESSFTEIILGLKNNNVNNGEPLLMQLVDNLNQRNQIIFFNSQINSKLQKEMFNFVIPKDRDIIEN